MTSRLVTINPGNIDLQKPFDTAVVIPSVARPSLVRAVESAYRQEFAGTIQVLVGIDTILGDPSVLAQLESCPNHCVLTWVELGYSTSVRHGGLHPGNDGGVLRTILSYAANSRHVAYLDDDNWWGPHHLASLRKAIDGIDWAFSLRWFVDPQTLKPLGIDEWESLGPDAGVYKERFGGFVDPNCLMIDKLTCEPVLRWWSIPSPGDPVGMSGDRHVFKLLRDHFRWKGTNLPTTFYVLNPNDAKHPIRERRLAARLARPQRA